MATGSQGEFVAVVNDTDPKSNGKAYSLKISGNNYSQILGKKIGDIVDGIFKLLDKKPSGSSDWTGKKPNPSFSSAPWNIFNIGNNKPTELEYFINIS